MQIKGIWTNNLDLSMIFPFFLAHSQRQIHFVLDVNFIVVC